MSSLVYNLAEAPDEPASVGGKGAALGRLARSGLPVPAGFVLSAGAFRAFLDANGLDHAHDGASEDEVAARFRAASWPDPLRAEIASAYEALREGAGVVGPVAVRSSATAEDGSAASFAGQHATLLNVTSLDGVLESVLECWASLYRAEALHYRETRQVEDAGPAMAVVVQTLVPSDASGVAFTLDPVSGDRDIVVIEAAFGLGESVVSGVVTPDHFAVRKSDGAIVRREVATKHLRTSPVEGGGTQDQQLPPERANAPSLTDGQAVELARIAAGIEADAGAPQDIEWALAEGRFFILQARPITAAAAPAAAPPPPDEWVSEF
ncbi:MAG: PEP/pyruvate-binding domain-containing protein, partial [Dehalococcoidia bacterium]